MRSLFPLALIAAAMLFGANRPAFADDMDHFQELKVSPDEARILALADVRDFSCNYEVRPSPATPRNALGSGFNYQQELQLFAELYEGTTCVGRYRLGFSINALNDLSLPLKGILSFGWNSNAHELVSVIDNEQFYSPWSASVVLKDFSYSDHCFFETSAPEKRVGLVYGSGNFDIYPVAGICGKRKLKINDAGFANAASFLKACKNAGAKNAIVVYLYKGSDSPPLKFHQPFLISHLWLPAGLGVASALAAITFLLHHFTTRSKPPSTEAG